MSRVSGCSRAPSRPSSQRLHVEPAAVAAEIAAGAKHPVAGDDDRDRVASHRVAGGADGRAGCRRPRRARSTCAPARTGWQRRPPAPAAGTRARAASRSASRTPSGGPGSTRRARGGRRPAAPAPRAPAARRGRPAPASTPSSDSDANDSRTSPRRGRDQRAARTGASTVRIGDVQQSLVGARMASSSTRVLFMCPLLPDGGQAGAHVLAGGRLAAIDDGADGAIVEVAGEPQGDRGPLLLGQPAHRRPQGRVGLGGGDRRRAPARSATGDGRRRAPGGRRAPCDGRSAAASRAGSGRRAGAGRRAAPPASSPASSPRRPGGRRPRADSAARRSPCCSSSLWNGGSRILRRTLPLTSA